MDGFLPFLSGVIAATLITALTATAFAVKSGEDSVYREAIERGFAEYCPKTDDFAWLGECK